MATKSSIASTLDGTVASVNQQQTGLRLQDRDGWLNFSKFGTRPTIPTRGDQVRLGLDAGGFIRSVEILSEPAPTPIRQEQPTRSYDDTFGTPDDLVDDDEGFAAAIAAPRLPDTDRRIVRQTALKVAAELVAAALATTPADPRRTCAELAARCCSIAEQLERWVYRPV